MIFVYCSLAGLIVAWTISGLLTIVDFISQTPSVNRLNGMQYIWTNIYILERLITL